MKWTNKGHEYDALYNNICKKKAYYLFGAGDYGKLFLKEMEQEIVIKGFIDNNIEKQKKGYCGYQVFSMDVLKELKDDEAVILTISQFMRASAKKQLKDFQLVEHKDYVLFEEFISVYYIYKYGKTFMSTISFLPSTVCNLRCKHCLNFNPFAKQYYQRGLEDLKRDINLFFSRVDRVMIFHLSGGEPMLYPHFSEIVQYIDKNYGKQIGIFRTVTNGTVVPSEEVLTCLAQCNIELTVDDYRDAVPHLKEKFDQLIQKLDEFEVCYVINKADEWVDLAPEKSDFADRGEEWLSKHFDECCQTWHELRDGKLFMCNYASYAQVAGLIGANTSEFLDLEFINDENKKELIEFRLGYSEKGYTDFCKKCRGFTVENSEGVRPAEQVPLNHHLNASR